ncbi:MAG: class I SAM-dependent methyltransferase [Promethearchaeota archaeon]
MTIKNINVVQIGFRSIVYRSAYVYDWFTHRLYDQNKKFSTIAALIGNNSKLVLDLPCGTGYLTRYLHPSIEYTGYDLNHRFLKKIKKNWLKGKIKLKKVILKQINIFDFYKYPKIKQDVIVFCDILHHLHPRHVELVEGAKNHSKKIIICEPVAVKPQDINAHDFIAKMAIYIAKFLPERLLKIVDFFFADNDGINSYERRSEWKHNEKSLALFYKNLGFTKIFNINDNYIGIWEE